MLGLTEFVDGTPFALFATVAATASALVGLYIGGHAFRGFRRYDDPSMRYLAAGMILLFGVTYTVALVGQGLFSFRILPLELQGLFRFVVRGLQFVGLACIPYSLHVSSSRV